MIFKRRAKTNLKVKHNSSEVGLAESEVQENVQHQRELNIRLDFGDTENPEEVLTGKTGGKHQDNQGKTRRKFRFKVKFRSHDCTFELNIDPDNIELTEKAIFDDVYSEALTINLPTKTAEIFAQKVAERVARKIQESRDKKAANRYIAEELQKYNDDLAYVYENRGKII